MLLRREKTPEDGLSALDMGERRPIDMETRIAFTLQIVCAKIACSAHSSTAAYSLSQSHQIPYCVYDVVDYVYVNNNICQKPYIMAAAASANIKKNPWMQRYES